MILAVSISSYSVIKRSFAVIGFVGVDGVWLLTELCVMAVFSCLILSLSLFSLSSRNGVFSSKSSDISSRWSNSCWFCSNCACSCGVRLWNCYGGQCVYVIARNSDLSVWAEIFDFGNPIKWSKGVNRI